MIAVRDPNGFRPLCYGVMEDGSYVVASESCALDAVGAEFIRDLDPGEIIVFDKNGLRSTGITAKKSNQPSVSLNISISPVRTPSSTGPASTRRGCVPALFLPRSIRLTPTL